jgi:hypothetical protein
MQWERATGAGLAAFGPDGTAGGRGGARNAISVQGPYGIVWSSMRAGVARRYRRRGPAAPFRQIAQDPYPTVWRPMRAGGARPCRWRGPAAPFRQIAQLPYATVWCSMRVGTGGGGRHLAPFGQLARRPMQLPGGNDLRFGRAISNSRFGRTVRPFNVMAGLVPAIPAARCRDDRGREGHRPPLPPNRTGGSPASGSPVGGLTYERASEPHHRRPAS